MSGKKPLPIAGLLDTAYFLPTILPSYVVEQRRSALNQGYHCSSIPQKLTCNVISFYASLGRKFPLSMVILTVVSTPAG